MAGSVDTERVSTRKLKRRLRKLRRLSRMQPDEDAFVPYGANHRAWLVIKEEGRSMLSELPTVEILTDSIATLQTVLTAMKAGTPDLTARAVLVDKIESAVSSVIPSGCGDDEDGEDEDGEDEENMVSVSKSEDLISVAKSLKMLSLETSGYDLNLTDKVDKVLGIVEGVIKALPPAGKSGGSKSPPKGYPEDPAAYADPKNYKYPLDTEVRVRSAISYLSVERNARGYSASELASMWGRIRSAAKKYGIEISADKTGACSGKDEKEKHVAKTGADQTDATQPDAAQTVATQTVATQTVATQPDATQPDISSDGTERIAAAPLQAVIPGTPVGDTVEKPLSEPVVPEAVKEAGQVFVGTTADVATIPVTPSAVAPTVSSESSAPSAPSAPSTASGEVHVTKSDFDGFKSEITGMFSALKSEMQTVVEKMLQQAAALTAVAPSTVDKQEPTTQVSTAVVQLPSAQTPDQLPGITSGAAAAAVTIDKNLPLSSRGLEAMDLASSPKLKEMNPYGFSR